jgi:hypothetical protein
MAYRDYLNKYAVEEGTIADTFHGDAYRVITCDEVGQGYIMAMTIKVGGNGDIVWKDPRGFRCIPWEPASPPIDDPRAAQRRCDDANELHRAMRAELRDQGTMSLDRLGEYKDRIKAILDGSAYGEPIQPHHNATLDALADQFKGNNPFDRAVSESLRKARSL